MKASAQPAPIGRAVDSAALTKALNAVDTKGFGRITGSVVDLQTGTSLYARANDIAMVPASTNKLLTSAVALDVLGADTRFTTTVVQPSANRIVLVGGGDPYLTKATKGYPNAPSSATLAARTAAQLKAKGVTKVSLGFDASLFTGPAWHPDWPDRFHDQVATLSPLWIDQGRKAPTGMPGALTTPQTAAVFAAQLKANGITVVGTPVAARGTGEKIAAVDSLPVRTIVGQVLLHSDNSASEVLLRHIGRVGAKDASFVGGAKVVHSRLAALKVPTAGMRTTDGSGLSANNRIPARTLTALLRVAATEPKLRPLIEGLPTAGVNGTLQMRYYQPATFPGRGLVHAKTGNLNKVSTLAGITRTAAGRPVAFAFMSNGATAEWEVRSYLDQLTAVVASCPC